jgi:2-dehydro-3-deoxyphosphogluconate aldolase / (4S)-4-hydroxy-2-oxoglutarate aldolase
MSAASPTIAELLARAPVIPVYTPSDADEAVAVAAALVRGGLPVIEVTLRGPAGMPALAAIASKVPGAIVGAGTVLDAEQMHDLHRAGAAFAVSPGSRAELSEAARRIDLPYLPAVATASELMAGLAAGFDCFKLFPAAVVGGTALLRAFAGPFPRARFCPTGGISATTAGEYLQLPNVLCIGGSWLTTPELLATQDWERIETLARAASGLRRARGAAFA